MKIDREYLKGLLEAFESSDNPTTDIRELQLKGFSTQESNFLFHLQILGDQGLVQRENGGGLGYTKGADGFVSWSVVPLRLTSQGHDFIEALRNSEVWVTIKKEFKDASLGTLLHISKELLEGYTKKKVISLLSGE